MNPRTIDAKYEGKNSKGEKAELHIPMRALWQSDTTGYYTQIGEHVDKPIEEKNALQYAVRLEAVASWAVGMPFVRTFDKKGKPQDKPFATSGTPEAAIRERFKDVTPENDWTLHYFIEAVVADSVNLSLVF